MGFQKFSPFLALGILVLFQAGSLQAAPSRSALERSPDLATLSEEKGRLLLAALQDYVQLKTSELQQEQETKGSSPRSKRCSKLSTCMLSTYSQNFSKFHTFPKTAVGPGAPGKKRDVYNSLERDHHPHVGMPQDPN
ncbi:calcitonin [Callithrix jacchus]|nr:calcitonin [Callithrix jacchus]XP_009005968.1 calcitonin [Callithrix jacchus]